MSYEYNDVTLKKQLQQEMMMNKIDHNNDTTALPIHHSKLHGSPDNNTTAAAYEGGIDKYNNCNEKQIMRKNKNNYDDDDDPVQNHSAVTCNRRGMDYDDTSTPEESMRRYNTAIQYSVGSNNDEGRPTISYHHNNHHHHHHLQPTGGDDTVLNTTTATTTTTGTTNGNNNNVVVAQANNNNNYQYNNNNNNQIDNDQEEGSSGLGAHHHHDHPHHDHFISASLVDTENLEERERIRRQAEEDIINKAVIAEEIHPNTDTTNKYSFKWYILILLLCCVATLLIVAIAIGTYFGIQRKNNNKRINENNNNNMDNSFCNKPLPIIIDGQPIISSIAQATPVRQQQQQDQGNNNNKCSFFDDDYDNNENGIQSYRGRWFSFVGDGSSVTASTCQNTNFDSRISIYSGSTCSISTGSKRADLSSLSCIDGNDNNPTVCCTESNNDNNCEERSAVTWIAINGLQYFIYVHGTNSNNNDDNDDDGNFELLLTSSSIASNNNVCQTAIRITSKNGIPIIGSNEFATNNNNIVVPTCGTVTQIGPGVWYEVEGVGGLMSASTCSNDSDDNNNDSPSTATSSSNNTNATTNSLIDTQITILKGNCNNDNEGMSSTLQCIAANDNEDDYCGNNNSNNNNQKSRVTWESIEKETYYIYIHSHNENDKGTFQLYVESLNNNDGECFDNNVKLYETPGIGDTLRTYNDNLLSSIGIEDVCTISGSTLLCTVNLSNYQHNLNSECSLENNARYIELNGNLTCSNGLTIQLYNYPNCVSYICNNKQIKDFVRFQFDTAIAVLAGQGLRCNLDELTFKDG